jgi:outer membrane immunogenic protein
MVGREPGFDVAADDASRGGGSLIAPNSSFDIGARAGYVVGGNALLYARGSYEYACPRRPQRCQRLPVGP